MAQLDLIFRINAIRTRLSPTVSIQKKFDAHSVRQGSERYEPANLRTFMSCMNSARDAGGRPPKLDLIHKLQSRTNDAGHNANLTRETLSIMVTARLVSGVRSGCKTAEQCCQKRRVAPRSRESGLPRGSRTSLRSHAETTATFFIHAKSYTGYDLILWKGNKGSVEHRHLLSCGIWLPCRLQSNIQSPDCTILSSSRAPRACLSASSKFDI
jgi:hypothetical protein